MKVMAKPMPVITRTVPTPDGDATAIEIECSIDHLRGGFAFHNDGDVTMAIADGGEIVMSNDAAKAFIGALFERINANAQH